MATTDTWFDPKPQNPPHNPQNIYNEFNNLPEESKTAYRNCMSTEAVYMGGIPVGLGVAGLSHYVCSLKGQSHARIGQTIVLGMLGYIVGKFSYSLKCLRKHVPELLLPKENYTRAMLDKLQNQSYSDESDKIPIEEESMWTNFDTFASDNSDQFATANNDIEEVESERKRTANVKRYVTYDELRRQSRGEFYNNLRREEEKQRKEVLVKTSPSTASDASDIWG